MDIEVATEAEEFGRSALRAFRAAGGDALVKRGEAAPAERAELVQPVFTELGAWDLRPRENPGELEAAAVLCRSAGYWAVPYPVAERLARPTDPDVCGLLVVSSHSPKAPVAGLEGDWTAVSLDGQRYRARARPGPAAPTASAFAANLDLHPLAGSGSDEVALVLALQCWTLLGMLDRAVDLTREYVTVRKQFGQPLATFQSVRFQLADAEVQRLGLDVLAKHALWSLQSGRAESLDDVLALRMVALEAADAVFRIAHQLHGAFGFCDEASLSWISRNSTPLRQLPIGLSATRDALTERLSSRGQPDLFVSSA